MDLVFFHIQEKLSQSIQRTYNQGPAEIVISWTLRNLSLPTKSAKKEKKKTY